MSLLSVSRDLASGASAWKHACRVVSTSNITLSGLQTIDGVALAAGDRVLVAGQTAGAQNGLYNAFSGRWTRTDDADQANDVKLGMTVAVLDGTAYAGSTWRLTSPTTGNISLGSTELVFERVSLTDIQGTTVKVGTDGAETVSVGTAATSALDLAGASLAAAVTGNVVVESTGGDATLGADGDVNITASNGAVTITAPDIALTGDVTVNGDPIGDPPIVKHTTSGTLTARAINILSGTATSMTMPAQSGWAGGALVVKKANLSGDVTITRSGSDTIDGATTYTLTGSYGCATFIADDSTAVIYAAPGLS